MQLGSNGYLLPPVILVPLSLLPGIYFRHEVSYAWAVILGLRTNCRWGLPIQTIDLYLLPTTLTNYWFWLGITVAAQIIALAVFLATDVELDSVAYLVVLCLHWLVVVRPFEARSDRWFFPVSLQTYDAKIQNRSAIDRVSFVAAARYCERYSSAFQGGRRLTDDGKY